MKENLEKPRKYKLSMTFGKILTYVSFAVIIILTGIFLLFNYYGEVVLKGLLQEKIRKESAGLYHIDFDKLKFNLFTGRFVIKDFLMTPDTSIYNKLQKENKIRTALYIISFKSFILSDLDPAKFYLSHVIRVKNLQLNQLEIFIVAFPDEKGKKKGEFTTLYEDINPVISRFFKDFHIDSINVNNGIFYWKHKKESGRFAEGNYTYSVILRDFTIRPGSFTDPSRVFYSTDIELKIKNFQYSLADSLYFIKAKEAGFSLKSSRIFGKNISLSPNYNSERIKEVKKGEFYQIDLPELNISGVDIYKTLTDKKVEINKVHLESCAFKVIGNPASMSRTIDSVKKKQIPLADLYTIIAGELKSINIQSLILNHSDFSYFRGLSEPLPELKIGDVSVTMDHFSLDSLANRDPGKILYAKDIDLTLGNFKLTLRDKIHTLLADKVQLSTKQSLIDVTGASLSPGKYTFPTADSNRVIFNFLLPRLTISGVDLRKTFNQRILEFDHLAISEPDLRIRMKQSDHGKVFEEDIAKAFPEKGNKDVLFEILSPYLEKIKANNVTVSKGEFRLSRYCGLHEKQFSSGQVDLDLKGFCLDSIHHFNQKEFFYSRDINIYLRKFSFETSDSNYSIKADNIFYSTDDSVVQAENFTFGARPRVKLTTNLDIHLEKILISGLDNFKLLTEKKLFVQKMKLVKPSVRIFETQSGNENYGGQKGIHNSINELPGFIKAIIVYRLSVIDGSVDLSRDVKNKTSSLSVNGYNLNLDNLKMEFINNQHFPVPFKFDSLNLNLTPSGSVIADSLYLIGFTKLTARSNPSDINIQDLHLSALIKETDAHPALSFTAFIPELLLKDLPVYDLIWKKDFTAKNIFIRNPFISVEIQRGSTNKGKEDNNIDLLSFKSGKLLNSVKISDLIMDQAQLHMVNHFPDTMNSIDLNNLSLAIKNLVIDSTAAENHHGRLFNADDIRIQLPGYSWVSNDSLYTYKIENAGLSTGQKQVTIDTFSIIPNYSKFDFSRKLWFQQDRLDIKMDQIDISGVHFREFILNKKFIAGKIRINGMIMDAYRDKRVPVFAWQTKPLPQQMLWNLTTPINIDSIQLINGVVTYSEQTGEIPGTVFFNGMHALATHLTNETSSYQPGSSMTLEGSAYLMGKALIQASFHFPLSYRKDTFNYSATIGELDLTDLNSIVVPLKPLKIKSGKEKKTIIQNVCANNDYASGTLEVYYNDLKIDFRRTENNFFKKWKSDLMTFVADDIVLPASNPGRDGKLKKGIIYWDRDKNKGFFNYIWKSAWSGLKSTVGLNSKQQREIKRTQKKESSN